MDAVGLGPVETPSEVVASWPGVRLRAYADPGAGGPAVLIVPAPIKRAYIWDLVPWASVVRRCLDGGMLVHLAEWTPPGAHPATSPAGQRQKRSGARSASSASAAPRPDTPWTPPPGWTEAPAR